MGVGVVVGGYVDRSFELNKGRSIDKNEAEGPDFLPIVIVVIAKRSTGLNAQGRELLKEQRVGH